MTIRSEELRYDIVGLNMKSRFYFDASQTGPRPGVMVFPDARGLDDVAHKGAERLAREGFAALACDIYGDARYMPDPQEAIPFATRLAGNFDTLDAVARGTITAFTARPEVEPARIAAMGYCMGGNVSVEMARAGLPILAAIGFHGGTTAPNPERTARITGKVLVCTGSNDPMIPIPQRNAFEEDMRAAGIDFRLHIYGNTWHSFTNPECDSLNMPEALRYDPCVTERAWSEMKALLGEVFN